MAGNFKQKVMVEATVPLVPTWVTRNGNVRRVSTLKDKTLRGIVRRAERARIDFRSFRVFQAVKDELARRSAASVRRSY